MITEELKEHFEDIIRTIAKRRMKEAEELIKKLSPADRKKFDKWTNSNN